MTNNDALRGRVCMVTGATSGIGQATALAFARLGATVIAVGRDEAKGARVVKDIGAQSGNDKVELLQCDLASQRSIRDAAANFRARHSQLHVLVNQAGLYTAQRSVTVDGIETMFAVNHLAYFLLTTLLLDTIKASAPSRIIIGTGGIEATGKINFDDIGFERSWKPFAALAQSKLANTLFLHELSRRVAGSGVAVCAFQPGGVRTSLGSGQGGPFGVFMSIVRRFGTTPEKAAQIPVHLATAPELASASGVYFNMMKRGESSTRSRDPALGKRLWELSEQLTSRSM